MTTAEPRMTLIGIILALIKLIIEIAIGSFVYIKTARMLGVEELGSIERFLGPLRRILNRLNLKWV